MGTGTALRPLFRAASLPLAGGACARDASTAASTTATATAAAVIAVQAHPVCRFRIINPPDVSFRPRGSIDRYGNAPPHLIPSYRSQSPRDKRHVRRFCLEI